MIIFIAVKIFKIKSEDKAALLNRLEKLGVHIDSNNVQDKSKLENGQVVKYFEVTIENPETEEIINSVINQSPTINTINDMEKNKTKMTKDELKEMVRQELQAVLAERKLAENMGNKDEEKKVSISLNEYVGADQFSYEVGQWVVKSVPKIAKWVMDSNTSGDPGQAIADLGSTVVALATVGTFMVSASLAVFKNDIVSAAKKLVGAVKGNPSATAEAADVTLDQIVDDMPEDIKAKIAAK
jgi:hypothetical protein